MTARDRLLALLVAVLWGLNFLAIRISLDHWPPFFLAALRFLVIAVPVLLFVPRPRVQWRWLMLYGTGFGTLQFAFLFLAIQSGMPTGLASLVLQASAPLTVLLGAMLLGEHVSVRQSTGIALAVLGMTVIAWDRAATAALLPVLLTLLAALGWALVKEVVSGTGATPRQADNLIRSAVRRLCPEHAPALPAPGAAPAAGSPTPSSAARIPGDGTLLVGAELKPGTYRSAENSGCYWARLRGLEGTTSEIITSDFVRGTALVTIKASDRAFQSKGCSDWTLLAK